MGGAVRLLLRAVGIQAGFVALWLLVAGPFTGAFSAGAQAMLGDAFGTDSMRIRPGPTSPLASANMEIEFRNVRARRLFVIDYGSGYGAYFPATFLLSLLLASPIPWRRRVGLAVVLQAVLGGVLLARIWILGLRVFGQPGVLQKFELPGSVAWTVDALIATIVVSPVSGMIFATILWTGAVAMRAPVVRIFLPAT